MNTLDNRARGKAPGGGGLGKTSGLLMTLIKKQFMELSTLFSMGKRRSKRGSAGGFAFTLILYAVIALSLGASMYALSESLSPVLLGQGEDWKLFVMMDILGIALATLITMFSADLTLFRAKDNEILLSMPIPPGYILLARMAPLYVIALMFNASGVVPAVMVYTKTVGLNIGLIVVGIILVIWGADCMTDGASKLARDMRVPEIVIGLTIVAAGTSAPELFVSLMSALKGTPDLAVGNVIGSNIFNTLLIVGCSAAVAPIAVAPNTVKKDIPFAIGASLLLFMLCADDMGSVHLWGNEISRSDGIILLIGFVAFMVYTFQMAAKDGKLDFLDEELGVEREKPKKDYTHLWRNLFWIGLGLGCLIVGSHIFVNGATYVAYRFGIRQSVVGLTIVAGGTSLPELATSVVAAYKGRSAMAIGNVIGSNVFNILLILGITSVVHPMRIMGITIVDLMMMLISIGLMWIFAITKYFVSRREGWVLILTFMGYMGWLLYLL